MLQEMEEMEMNVRETAILLQESDPDYEANVIRSCRMQIAQFQPEYIACNSELGLIEGSPFYSNYFVHILKAVQAAVQSQRSAWTWKQRLLSSCR